MFRLGGGGGGYAIGNTKRTFCQSEEGVHRVEGARERERGKGEG